MGSWFRAEQRCHRSLRLSLALNCSKALVEKDLDHVKDLFHELNTGTSIWTGANPVTISDADLCGSGAAGTSVLPETRCSIVTVLPTRQETRVFPHTLPLSSDSPRRMSHVQSRGHSQHLKTWLCGSSQQQTAFRLCVRPSVATQERIVQLTSTFCVRVCPNSAYLKGEEEVKLQLDRAIRRVSEPTSTSGNLQARSILWSVNFLGGARELIDQQDVPQETDHDLRRTINQCTLRTTISELVTVPSLRGRSSWCHQATT